MKVTMKGGVSAVAAAILLLIQLNVRGVRAAPDLTRGEEWLDCYRGGATLYISQTLMCQCLGGMKCVGKECTGANTWEPGTCGDDHESCKCKSFDVCRDAGAYIQSGVFGYCQCQGSCSGCGGSVDASCRLLCTPSQCSLSKPPPECFHNDWPIGLSGSPSCELNLNAHCERGGAVMDPSDGTCHCLGDCEGPSMDSECTLTGNSNWLHYTWDPSKCTECQCASVATTTATTTTPTTVTLSTTPWTSTTTITTTTAKTHGEICGCKSYISGAKETDAELCIDRASDGRCTGLIIPGTSGYCHYGSECCPNNPRNTCSTATSTTATTTTTDNTNHTAELQCHGQNGLIEARDCEADVAVLNSALNTTLSCKRLPNGFFGILGIPNDVGNMDCSRYADVLSKAIGVDDAFHCPDNRTKYLKVLADSVADCNAHLEVLNDIANGVAPRTCGRDQYIDGTQCKTCANSWCGKGEYRAGSCSGDTKGYPCYACPQGQYNDKYNADRSCKRCQNMKCDEDHFRTGSSCDRSTGTGYECQPCGPGMCNPGANEDEACTPCATTTATTPTKASAPPPTTTATTTTTATIASTNTTLSPPTQTGQGTTAPILNKNNVNAATDNANANANNDNGDGDDASDPLNPDASTSNSGGMVGGIVAGVVVLVLGVVVFAVLRAMKAKKKRMLHAQGLAAATTTNPVYTVAAPREGTPYETPSKRQSELYDKGLVPGAYYATIDDDGGGSRAGTLQLRLQGGDSAEYAAVSLDPANAEGTYVEDEYYDRTDAARTDGEESTAC